MSDTEEYVQPPIPIKSLRPMVLANEPPKEEESTFELSSEGLKEAASERVDNGPEADVITIIDAQTGEPRPSNETLSAESAAKELARYRNANEDVREQRGDQAVRDIVDHIQTNAANPDLQPAAQQPQQQVQPEQQQQQPEQAAQQYPPGVDPDVARVLAENPKVRAALQAEVQQVHTAHQSLVDATRANANMAVASLMAAWPEMSGVQTAEQMRGAI